MDAKKKLDGAYAPDKETRKERIVVGISGGLDSLVAAYLLKIQKYEVFAVTVVPGWDQFLGNKTETLACHLDDERMEFVREFCHQLKVPHHVVKASDFQETVVEEWMSAKVTGTASNACWTCHGLRMRILYQKMRDLDARYLATGHYAKVFHNAGSGSYYVHTSNDEENDQSALLSRLPSEILESLMLPLSDLQKREVVKLAENFGLSVGHRKLKMHRCFPTTEKTIEYLSARLPKSMVAPGEMYNSDGTEMFGEHPGIIFQDYGQPIRLEGQKKQDLFLAQYGMKEKKIVLETEDYFERESVQLVDCEFSEDVSWVEPLKAVIRVSDESYIDCWVYPKSQRSAFVEWEGRHRLKAGQILPVLRKKGKNSKIFLTGKVRFLTRAEVLEQDDREERPVTVDYSKDF